MRDDEYSPLPVPVPSTRRVRQSHGHRAAIVAVTLCAATVAIAASLTTIAAVETASSPRSIPEDRQPQQEQQQRSSPSSSSSLTDDGNRNNNNNNLRRGGAAKSRPHDEHHHEATRRRLAFDLGLGQTNAGLDSSLSNLSDQQNQEGEYDIDTLVAAQSQVDENGNPIPDYKSLMKWEDAVDIRDGKVTCDFVAATAAEATLLKEEMAALGIFQEAGVLEDGNTFSGFVQVDQLKAVNEIIETKLGGGAFLAASLKETQGGSVMSEGRNALNADYIQDTLGLRGDGMTVCILSDSFNRLGSATKSVNSGDLPPWNKIDIIKEGSVGGDEGCAMAELVFDVCPGCSLKFRTAFDGTADFASGIRKLADSGCDVIVDDVLYFAEPMFCDGPIAQAVADATKKGIPFFSAAGNYGLQSWTGSFKTSRNDGVMEFDDKNSIFLPCKISNSQSIVFTLQWSCQFISLGGENNNGCDTDLNIGVYDMDGKAINSGRSDNKGKDGIENVVIQARSALQARGTPNAEWLEVQLAIMKVSGENSPDFVKVTVSGKAEFDSSYPSTSSSTSYGHANAETAFGVAAASYDAFPRFKSNFPGVQTYSSMGGTPILYDLKAQRLPQPELRQQPRATGPDGAKTTFFGPGQRFKGTSAAAPHVAAIAALMLQQDANLTPEQIYKILGDTAKPVLGNGYNHRSGYGLIDGRKAIEKVIEMQGGGGSPTPPNPTPTKSPTKQPTPAPPNPTKKPTKVPTKAPTPSPTKKPNPSGGNPSGNGSTEVDCTIYISTDDYPDETTWKLQEVANGKSGSVIAKGGPYNKSMKQFPEGMYTLDEQKCYQFTIEDSYGDGICCKEGNGWYAIKRVKKDGSDALADVALGGIFGKKDTIEFGNCLGPRKIHTSTVGGLFWYGNMFTIQSLINIEIEEFSVLVAKKFEGKYLDVVGYYKEGGNVVQSAQDQSSWKTLFSKRSVKAMGPDEFTSLGTFDTVTLQAFQTYSFYLTFTEERAMRYSRGGNLEVGDEFFSNDFLKFHVGTSNTYPFGKAYNPRVANIGITYNVKSQGSGSQTNQLVDAQGSAIGDTESPLSFEQQWGTTQRNYGDESRWSVTTSDFDCEEGSATCEDEKEEMDLKNLFDGVGQFDGDSMNDLLKGRGNGDEDIDWGDFGFDEGGDFGGGDVFGDGGDFDFSGGDDLWGA